MAIIANFPDGITEITVPGLYQWDYGQSLEIHASDLGNKLVEVHFACPRMDEAIVRPCQLTQGVGAAVIPDFCIQQTKPVAVWIYEVGQTSGKTVKTAVLPIVARTKPEPSATIPQTVSDKYTEAIAAMNAAVDAIEAGTVTAAKAIGDKNGDDITATYYKKTDTVAEATHALSAEEADGAGWAETTDFTREMFELYSSEDPLSLAATGAGTYQMRIYAGTSATSSVVGVGFFQWKGNNVAYATVGGDLLPTTSSLAYFIVYRVTVQPDGGVTVSKNTIHLSDGTITAETTGFSYDVRKIR